jgi:hypothetical protein
MRRAIVVSLLSIGLLATSAAPAAAAPTRAEYIAQVDPMCQSLVGPMGAAWSSFNKAFKQTNHAAKKGNTKAFIRGARATIRSLNTLSATRTGLTDQIAAVQPPDADASTVSTWLGDRRLQAAFESSAASALAKGQFGKFFHRLGGAGRAQTAGRAAVAGFGFATCGSFPIQ